MDFQCKGETEGAKTRREEEEEAGDESIDDKEEQEEEDDDDQSKSSNKEGKDTPISHLLRQAFPQRLKPRPIPMKGWKEQQTKMSFSHVKWMRNKKT